MASHAVTGNNGKANYNNKETFRSFSIASGGQKIN